MTCSETPPPPGRQGYQSTYSSQQPRGQHPGPIHGRKKRRSTVLGLRLITEMDTAADQPWWYWPHCVPESSVCMVRWEIGAAVAVSPTWIAATEVRGTIRPLGPQARIKHLGMACDSCPSHHICDKPSIRVKYNEPLPPRRIPRLPLMILLANCRHMTRVLGTLRTCARLSA